MSENEEDERVTIRLDPIPVDPGDNPGKGNASSTPESMAGHEHATERGQSANPGGDGAAHIPPPQETLTAPVVEFSSVSPTQPLRSDVGEDSSQRLDSLGSDITGVDPSSPAISSKPGVQESLSSQHCENENEIVPVDVDGGLNRPPLPPPAGSEQKYREEWEGAKDRKDCEKLIELMKKEDFDFWQYENEKLERTALHVAAMQGCLSLVKLILMADPEIYNEESGIFRIYEMASYFPSMFFLYRGALDKQSQLSAIEVAYGIIGNKSISRLLMSVSADAKLFPASPLSKWYAATWERDCEKLKELLQWDSSFVLEHVYGVTVLHVGILEDNEELVKVVLNLFGPEKKIVWPESYYPPSLQLEDILRVSGNLDSFVPTGREDQAKQLKQSLGRKRWEAFIHHNEDCIALAKALNREAIAELLETLSIQSSATLSDQISVTSSDENDTNHDAIAVLPKTSNTQSSAILSDQIGVTSCDENDTTKFLPQKWLKSKMHVYYKKWQEEWNEGFAADVDFNFEVNSRRSLLRLHHACKDISKFHDFIKDLYFCVKDFPEDKDYNIFLFQDAQGRTPYYMLLNDAKILQEPFKTTFEKIMKYAIRMDIEDTQGRRYFDIYLLKNYIHHNILLGANLGSHVYESLCFKNGAEVFIFIEYLLLLTQTDLAGYCIERCIMENKERLFSWKNGHSLLLFTAASTGNQTILQLFLGRGFNPMIVDHEGRTLLHHATDPTLLLHKVDHLLFNKYSPTIDDYFKVKNKWNKQNNQWKVDKGIHLSSILDDTYKMNANSTLEKKSIDSNDKLNVEREACILMLLQVGVDLSQTDKYGMVPTIGPSDDATYQKWWYELVVKETSDKKNSFNQAGNALAVVGTLVASTSYIGPLQPPMNYTDGFVNISEKLVKVFMVSNTLAFYLAMASVMFGVVPSLPVPQESVMSELNRAQHMVSLSLCLLLGAIGLIIISFACASMVVVQDEQSFKQEDLLFAPSIIGWIFCLVAIIGYLIRLMRLVFYKNSIVRQAYQISFSQSIYQIIKYLFIGIAYILLLPLFIIIRLLYKVGIVTFTNKINVWLTSFEVVQHCFSSFYNLYFKIIRIRRIVCCASNPYPVLLSHFKNLDSDRQT